VIVVGVPAGGASGPGTPTPLPSSTGWTVEVVGLHGGSAPPDLALDSSGTPHVLYCPPGDSRYASRNESGWTDEHLQFTPFGGICGDLVLGPDDAPRVTTPYALPLGCVAYGVRLAGTWEFSCFPGGVMDAVDSLGRPHAVTYWTISPTRYDLRHLWREPDGSWQFETAESNALNAFPSLRWYSLVLDAADNPRILYYDSVRGDVRYAFRDASGWHVEVVEHAGFIGRVGRGGQLALRADGTPVAAYGTGLGPADLRIAMRNDLGWISEIVDASATYLVHPTLALQPDGTPCVAYEWIQVIDAARIIADQDLLFRCRGPSGWSREVVIDGIVDAPADIAIFPQFPDLKVDACGNPHLAFYYNLRIGSDSSQKGAYYATKGECSLPTATATLRVDPRTLNLKSKGRWITATVTLDGATADGVDLGSLAVNGVAPDKVQVLNDTVLQLKVSREDFMDTLPDPPKFGVAVAVTLTGKWKDGGDFTATDTIRILKPGR